MGALVVLGIIAVVAIFFFAHQQRKKVIAEWQAVADSLGLTLEGDDTSNGTSRYSEVAYSLGLMFEGNPGAMRGVVDGVALSARTYTTGSGKNRRRWTEVKCTPSTAPAVQLGSDGFLRRMFDLEDTEIGDPGFDRALRVRGDRGELLALLDEARRGRVRAAVAHGWKYEDGEWTLKVGGYAHGSLRAYIDRGLALAKDFSRDPANRTARLRERATTDVEPGVRRGALDVLVKSAPSHPDARAALEAARADADPEVRLMAARGLADVPLLAELARGADAVAIAALDTLAAEHAQHPAAEATMDALREGVPSAPVALRAKFAACLAHIGRPWGEAAALELLADEDDAVRLRAARTLGAIGAIPTAVPALVPLRDKFLGGELKDVARDAILNIQSRAGNPDAGALAVVEEGTEGRLAMAEHDA